MKIKVKSIVLIIAISTTVTNIAICQTSNWHISRQENPMDGYVIYSLLSNKAQTMEQVPFPYNDVVSNIVLACDSEGRQWAFLLFNELNVTGGDVNFSTKKETYPIRVKFDNTIKSTTMISEINITTDKLNFVNDDWFVNNLIKSDQVMIELDWFNAGLVHFNFDTKGFAEYYDKLKQKCLSITEK